MPIVPIAADLPPNWKVPVKEVRSCYALEGSVGHDLEEQFGRVISHWQSNPGYGIETSPNYDVPINHVPFNKVGTIKVRFKKARPMLPRTIEVEDIEKE